MAVLEQSGNNNNPTARQLKSVYKILLVNTQIKVMGWGTVYPIKIFRF